MTFEDYWNTQTKTLDEETNAYMQQVAKHVWHKATEEQRKIADEDILGLAAMMETGIIIY